MAKTIAWLDRKQMRKVMKLCEKTLKQKATHNKRESMARDAFAVSVGLLTGARVGEIAQLTWGDFWTHPERLLVRRGKCCKRRWIKLPSLFVRLTGLYRVHSARSGFPVNLDDAVFPSWRIDGAAMTKRALQLAIQRQLALCGITNLHAHGLRHTYATALYESSNENLEVVRQQLGHASTATTAIYIRTLVDKLQKALDNLF